MAAKKKTVRETATQARDGVNVPGMTTVVVASTILAIVALGAVWLL